ncbi:MAG: hypothetical protein ACMXX8_01460 [Candidatus Woesearchaeota archaeon]
MKAKNKLFMLISSLSNASSNIVSQSDKKVALVGVNKEKGWLYYVDEDGDISRTRAARGRKSSLKKKSETKKPKKIVKKKSETKKPKKVVKKKINKKQIPNISKKKQLLMNKIKLLEKKHSKLKKVKGHDELKNKIKLLKENLKKLK